MRRSLFTNSHTRVLEGHTRVLWWPRVLMTNVISMEKASGHLSAVSWLQSGRWVWDLHRSLLFYNARQYSGGSGGRGVLWNGVGCLLKGDGAKQPEIPANQEASQKDHGLIMSTN